MKSLDTKLAEVKANPTSRAFIIADAKDADMAFGVRAPGPRSYLSMRGERPARFSPEVWTREEFGYRNLPEFLDIIREVVHQGLIDIMLMSAYVNEQLTIKEGLFRQSHVTPAARANDATDVWAVRHGCYTREPAQPFRTATIDQIQCGKIECDRTTEEFSGANLGLYSVTFVNDLEQDRETLLAFKKFREEAERKKFRYFLEVFDPNVNSGVPPEKLGEFINDNIVRALAGVPESGRPLFLKIVYHGPRAMEELAQYDPKPGGGHPRRQRRHYLRRFPADSRRAEIRRARRPLWPQDQQRRAPTGVHRDAAPRSPTANFCPRKPCALIMACSRPGTSSPGCRSKRTWN